MDPEHIEWWIALQMKYRLRSNMYIDAPGYTELLQYAVYPSFGNPRSYDILQNTHGDEVAVWETIWRLDLDRKTISSPIEPLNDPRAFKPTVESYRLDVDHQSAREVAERFYGLSVPIHASDNLIGLDGISYELRIGLPFCCFCLLTWWSEIPKTWETLKDPVCKFERLLRSAHNRESLV